MRLLACIYLFFFSTVAGNHTLSFERSSKWFPLGGGRGPSMSVLADSLNYGIFCLRDVKEEIVVEWKCDPWTCLDCEATRSCRGLDTSDCVARCKRLLRSCSRLWDPATFPTIDCIFLGLRDDCSPVCPSMPDGKCADVTVGGIPLEEYVQGFPVSGDMALIGIIGVVCLASGLWILRQSLDPKRAVGPRTVVLTISPPEQNGDPTTTTDWSDDGRRASAG